MRILKNEFFYKILKAYDEGATKEELIALLGKGRAKKGMFLGDLKEGELEVGQIAALWSKIKRVRNC